MKVTPLLDNEGAPALWTSQLDFSYRDIPAGIANNTSYVWAAGFLPAVVAGDELVEAFLHLITPFANTADTGFNSDTFSFGDAGSATRYLSAVELNLNGTYVVDTHAFDKNFIYTAAGQLQITLNSMTGKSLSNLNQGKLVLYWKLWKAGAKVKNLDLSKPPYI